MIKAFILRRLGEASTYKGLLALAGVFGIAVAPDQAEAVITACIGIYGLFSAFFPNYFGKKKAIPTPVIVPEPDALGDGEVQPVQQVEIKKPDWSGRIPGQML